MMRCHQPSNGSRLRDDQSETPMEATTEMRMDAMVHADLTRARHQLVAGMPRAFGQSPCIGSGHGIGFASPSWTNALAVTAKAHKAFGAYGARRSEEHST